MGRPNAELIRHKPFLPLSFIESNLNSLQNTAASCQSPKTSGPKHQHSNLSELMDCLSAEFGIPFVPSRNIHGQACLNSTPEFEIATSALSSESPVCLQQDIGQYLIAIPLQKLGYDIAAIAWLSTETPHLYLRLANHFVEQHQSNIEINSLRRERQDLVQHMTDHLEELTFLRQITGMIDLPVDRDLNSVSERIFRLANRSIRAESLYLLDARIKMRCIARVGSNWQNPETLNWIVQRAEKSPERILVLNSLDKFDSRHPICELTNLVAIPIGTSEQPLGWIVAVNRHATETELSSDHRQAPEFGSSQASLLQSVADIVASQMIRLQSYAEKERLMTETVATLVTTVEAKDKYTFGHSERVALYATKLAELSGMGEEDQQRVFLCGLLHDIGKIGIPDALLGKPTRLTEAEYEIVKQHAEEGWRMLRPMSHLSHILDGILHHHENYDGAGYPSGLAGHEIPIDGRILAIADTFDALTSDRAYRSGMQVQEAANILANGSGIQWDPDLVKLFLQNLETFRWIKDNYQPKFRTTRCATEGAVPPPNGNMSRNHRKELQINRP